jgi:hypothetical protein
MQRRKETSDGLADIVDQVMAQDNDKSSVERILREKPELRQWEPDARQISETLGIPLSYLLDLDKEKSIECQAAATLIHQLRFEATQAAIAATKALEQLLQPVMTGPPEIKSGEAEVRPEKQSHKTLRRREVVH